MKPIGLPSGLNTLTPSSSAFAPAAPQVDDSASGRDRHAQYGRDPVLRRLAQGIIVAQQQEIELMERYLHKGSAPEQ
jgi:hypothetical protein